MTEWKYDKIFEQPRKGMHMQQLITYKIEKGKMVKETVTRRFYGKMDYQDSIQTEVICDAAE